MVIGTDVALDKKARMPILEGANILADAVTATLGPHGRCAVIEQGIGMPPLITKDGVTVAKNIFLADPLQNIGAQLLRVVASQTVQVSGDGTTTATLLAQAIFNEGLKAVEVGANPMLLKRGIELATKTVVEYVKKLGVPVKDDLLARVASISANNDEVLGKLIAEAVVKAGSDGVVALDYSGTNETYFEHVEGMQFGSGMLHSDFMTDKKSEECVLENVAILMWEKKLGTLSPARNTWLKSIVESGQTLLVIAEDVTGDALSLLAVNAAEANKGKKALQGCAVKMPPCHPLQRATVLDDIAAVVGGTPITEAHDLAIEKVTLAHLGHADRVIISKYSTSIKGGKGTRIAERAIELRSAMEREKDGNQLELLQDRLARLTGGVAIIRVGGATPPEVEERKFRIEDAMHATHAAIAEGIVPGGGTALARASKSLDSLSVSGDEKIGVEIVRKACVAPLVKIATNAGKQGGTILDKVLDVANTSWGYNALTDTYEDLIKSGVIDPVKVVYFALENASSVMALALLTESLITVSRPK